MDLQIGDASSSSDDDIDLGADRLSFAATRQSLASVYSTYDELIEAWSAHDLFSMFLQDQFSEEDFFARLHQQSVSKVLEKLNGGLRTIDHCISTSISGHLEDLIKQTVKVTGVERDAQSLLSDCDLLKSKYDSMYFSVMHPIAKIKSLVQNAEEAYERVELLRSILRFVQLCSKAKQSMANSIELSRVASILCEISNIVIANELLRIDSLRSDYDWVHIQVSSVRSQAEVLLKAAMLQNNQVQISSALQIAYNLSTLSSVVETVTKEVEMDFTDGVAQLCDNAKLFSPQAAKAKEAERSTSLNQSNQVRTIVWQRIESIFDLLFDTITCVHALYSVLDKKSNPISRQTYVEIIGDDLSVLIDIALGYFSFLKAKLSAFADSSKTVLNILTEEFPRLYDVCESCWQRGLSRLLPPDARMHMFRAIELFQTRYLSDRVEKIQGSISLMFPSGIASISAGVPTTSDISTVLNCVIDTLSSLESRTDLQRFVLKGFSGPLNLCVSKIEALLGNEAAASPLLWSSTKVERFNAILNITAHLEVQLAALSFQTHSRCRLLSKEVSEPLLRPVRQNVNSIALQILDPVFVLTLKNLERALQAEPSIISVLQSELERNKTILLKLSSKPRYLWMHMRSFISKVEHIILYRFVSVLSAVFIREARIEQVCKQLSIAEAVLKSYTGIPDPRRKADFVYPPKPLILKLPLFRNWITSGEWRHPNQYELAAIPKIVFVICSIGMTQNQASVCDLLCMTPIKLYQWLITHSETEAMALCRDHLLMNIVADGEQSGTILHFITDLVDNKI